MIWRKGKAAVSLLLITALSLCCTDWTTSPTYAKEISQTVSGTYYEFDSESEYTFSEQDTVLSNRGELLGTLTVSGNCSCTGNVFTVSKDTLSVSYNFDKTDIPSDETGWHIIADDTKSVNGIELDEKVRKGALIVQTSLDGEKWTKDIVLTDIFDSDTEFREPIYTTKDIQQQNGCYYRVVVVYEIERTIGSHKVTFIEVEDKETKRVAEVYEFYAIDEDTGDITTSGDTPRKELGTKVKTETNKGYSGEKEIDRNDPHYGWNIGFFTVNGYTRETKNDEGTPVFLKNVGDKVVLWFTLKQDIDSLNNDSALSIANDTGAYDQHFEISRTNFGRGTLIIQYTDYQGQKHDPIVYTNYLEANSRTGADTKVQLFEEGDYEVSLDYEIKNSPRQVGSISVLPTYTDYKITFSFSIRNGNCMVFPCDVKTNSELSDKAITPNGFRLDMAKSRYLTIDVERQTIQVNVDGTISTDTRFNRPAKDNESYDDEGIYIFTVKNMYTGSSPTTKTVYVGTNKYLMALSKSGLSVTELNAKILDGYIVEENGTLSRPTIVEEEPAPEETE